MDTDSIIEKITNMSLEYAPKVLLAIVTLILGFWIIGRIVKAFIKVMETKEMETSLIKFLASILGIALKVMLLLSVATMFGINTTSFVAILGALMIGIGMALNGSLGHLASGIMLMIFKPFKVGDLVIIGGGETGVVLEINAFNTVLKNVNNRRIILANSNVTGNTITNITGQGITGIQLTFGIGYDDDIDKAREIILKIGKSCEYVLEDPAQVCVVSELGDSSVNLTTRPFSKSEHYWDVLFFMQENVKKAFDKEGIGIPYPQMDVHMVSNN